MIKDTILNNENTAINTKEISILKEHFSSCFKKDGSFDIERFKEELKDKVDVVHEGYELKFLGKSYAKLLASLDTTTVITPNTDHNNLPENKNSENIYISGDNLDGLKHLLKSYSKSVKCIYIDPPYNTGSDGFVYKDNFNFTVDELQDKLSVDETQAKRILDLTKRDSASHSAWLMFMYARLQLAKDLLKDDGVIFISIDDNEQANLKLLCDDIFGEENFLGNLPTIMNLKGNNDEFGFSGTHEYTIVYSKNKTNAQLYELNINEEEVDSWEEDEIGFFKKGRSILATSDDKYRESRPFSYFPFLLKENNLSLISKEEFERIYDNEEKIFDDEYVEELKNKYELLGYEIILPINNSDEKCRWTWGFDGKINTHLNDLIVTKTKNGFSLNTKQRPSLGELLTKKPKTIFYKPEYSSGNGTNQVKELLGIKAFSNPKPIDLIEDLITIGGNKDSLFLDFFSGSASLANAVVRLNSFDSGSRKFISIQLPEKLDVSSLIQKNAFDFLKSNNRPTTLDYVGVERIIRASKKIKVETEAEIDFGFKHFILNEPNQNTLDKLESFSKVSLLGDATILDDFGTETVLTTWLNNDGYGLNANVETIELNGYTAYYYKKHLYLINPNFTQEAMVVLFEKYDTIVGFNPENIVLFGYSFNEWSVTEMLEKNLRILNDSEKNLKINIDVRY
ncbi:site-specific DNA-methyltransferase [Flavobacterium eburneipallidum]|uniref:site-specific DNA-methyltransferase n=1 Tax=Flavobacterium eburneipallidum TaxID=3003263 RepID=UPI0022ABD9E2|nr:site-specific DNA-methyltransferase [Flavobacterium eburneipallidum]